MERGKDGEEQEEKKGEMDTSTDTVSSSNPTNLVQTEKEHKLQALLR